MTAAKPHGYYTTRITDALARNGPMTATQIARLKNIDRATTSMTLCRMRKAPKRVYIYGYVRTDPDASTKVILRPLYDLGDKPDTPKSTPRPKTKPPQVRSPGIVETAIQSAPNSVFALGIYALTSTAQRIT